MEFDFDSRVTCVDGSAGSLVGLMTDPIERSLRHIAVEPSHRPGRARLVAASLVVAATPWGVTLGCSREDVNGMPPFRDVEFFPHGAEYGAAVAALAGPDRHHPAAKPLAVFVERVPAGEVEIRCGEPVHAPDGAIGRVEGVAVDDRGRITHILLEEGHLGRRREVAIPAGSLERIDASGIHTPLSKHQIAALPEIGIDLAGSWRGLA